MDPSGTPSSPPTPSSDLPPSSAPDPFDATTHTGTTPRRPTANALTLDDDDEVADDETQRTTSSKRRRRQMTQANGDVSLVKDAVGETLGESFESFLRT